MTFEQIQDAARVAFPDDEDRVRTVSDENCPSGCVAWIGFEPSLARVNLAEVNLFAAALGIPSTSVMLQADDDGITIEVHP